MDKYRQYYIDRIIECAARNELYDYTINKLNLMDENELIAIWDTLRWTHGDLAAHKRQ